MPRPRRSQLTGRGAPRKPPLTGRRALCALAILADPPSVARTRPKIRPRPPSRPGVPSRRPRPRGHAAAPRRGRPGPAPPRSSRPASGAARRGAGHDCHHNPARVTGHHPADRQADRRAAQRPGARRHPRRPQPQLHRQGPHHRHGPQLGLGQGPLLALRRHPRRQGRHVRRPRPTLPPRAGAGRPDRPRTHRRGPQRPADLAALALPGRPRRRAAGPRAGAHRPGRAGAQRTSRHRERGKGTRNSARITTTTRGRPGPDRPPRCAASRGIDLPGGGAARAPRTASDGPGGP